MGVVEQSSGEIESYLSSLEESYGSFSINQRSVGVSAEQYDREHAREESVEVHVRVTNDAGETLHVEEDGAETLPSTTVPIEGSLEPTAKETVAEKAGISCRIQELEAVTIIGLHNSNREESETLYRLAMLFRATGDNGEQTEQALWKDDDKDSLSFLT